MRKTVKKTPKSIKITLFFYACKNHGYHSDQLFSTYHFRRNLYKETKNHRKQVPAVPYRSHYNKFKMAATAEIFRIIYSKKIEENPLSFMFFACILMLLGLNISFMVWNFGWKVIFEFKPKRKGKKITYKIIKKCQMFLNEP